MTNWKRALALVLAAAMCFTLLCSAALADEGAPAGEEASVTEEAPAGEETPADEETPGAEGQPKAPTTLTLDRKTVYLAVGDTLTLNATVSDEQEVLWASLTWDVAQVDEMGTVTALSEGQTTVKATTADGSASAMCTVIVYMAFPSYSLREGEKVALSTALSGGSWTVADTSVATVDDNGVVTGRGFGRTYVTVSDGTDSETFSITVGGHVGIDISSWNNTIDWEALKEQGIEFVMIRAGYGWEHTDARFVENIEGAIAHDMPVGVYFYSYAETAEKAQVEADYCAKLLAPYRDSITLPVAYDLEQYSSLTGAQLVEFAEIFCGTLQEAGFHTMVYANTTFFRKMDLNALRAMGVDCWYAWYPAVPNLLTIPTVRGSGSSAKPNIWQHSSSCVVQGALASGKTDINVLYMPEYLNITVPEVTAQNLGSSAQIRWSGSTYAASYTVYRKSANGDVQQVGTFDGTVHTCTDTAFLPGMGYFVTMEVSDPIDGTYYKSFTSDAVYPEAALFDVKVTAEEGGAVSGGGSFVVGKTATVTAQADEGYAFAGWYDASGNQVSSAAEYSFTVTSTITLTAKFTREEIPVISNPFTDVKETDWFAEAVFYALEHELFNGTSDTTFSPQVTMTRGMLVTVLYRQAGSPEVSNHNKFVDVSATAWYAKAVTWAYNNGVVNGTGTKTFSPNEPVTREQMATILLRYSNAMGLEVPETTAGDLSAFTDGGTVSAYALDGMRWAVATQLMNGSNSQLMPKKGATRAECATILMRWLESAEVQ